MIGLKKLLMNVLPVAVLVFSSLGMGLAGTAFGQMDNSTNSNSTMASSTGNMTATTTSSSNASKLMGVLASIQQDGNGRPPWIIAGHWWLESDSPLIGNNATGQPHVSNFTADLFMVSNQNGTAFHSHRISNFTQTSVLHQEANTTTVNGTFTITLREGPVNNVRGYIHIINDKIEFWVDPMATDNHFGPTTITGMVLNPEKVGHMGNYHEEMMMKMGSGTMTKNTNATDWMMKNNMTKSSR